MEQEFVKREPLREPYILTYGGGIMVQNLRGNEGSIFKIRYKHSLIIFL